MKITSLISKLVSINSIYPNESKVTKALVEILGSAGFEVEIQEVEKGRANIFATKGSGDKAILFYGHQDTVPLVNQDQWETDPFTLTEKDDQLFGLGSYDMKGGVAAFIQAASKSNSYTKIFLAVDEENISGGAWHALENNPDFFSDVELIISAEPNFGLGLHGITRARTGRVIYQVEAKGIPEHISMYEQAEDAMEKLAIFITNLYRTRKNLFQDKKTVAQIRKIAGESVGMSVAAKAEAEVEVLLGAEDSIESVKSTLLTLGPVEINLKPRPTPYLSGYRFKSFLHQDTIAKIIKKQTGQKMSLHERSSVGDDNVLATLNIPVITWGPDGGNAHKPNEWVSKTSLKHLSKMYQQLLDSLEA